MNIRIINEDEVNLNDIKAYIMADLVFNRLMQQTPEIRKALYKKLLNDFKIMKNNYL